MPHSAVKTSIVGFGNVLLGDDGFGVEVIKRLACSELLGTSLSVAVDAAVARAVEKIHDMVGSDASGTACGH
jgi:Ni,Fe-hydrogenase maturation factor